MDNAEELVLFSFTARAEGGEKINRRVDFFIQIQYTISIN
jgi:hypothetical protein